MIKEEGEDEEDEEEDDEEDEEEDEEDLDDEEDVDDVRKENVVPRRPDIEVFKNRAGIDDALAQEPPLAPQRAGELGYSRLEGQEATEDDQDAPEASSTCSSDLSFGGTSSGTSFF